MTTKDLLIVVFFLPLGFCIGSVLSHNARETTPPENTPETHADGRQRAEKAPDDITYIPTHKIVCTRPGAGFCEAYEVRRIITE